MEVLGEGAPQGQALGGGGFRAHRNLFRWAPRSEKKERKAKLKTKKSALTGVAPRSHDYKSKTTSTLQHSPTLSSTLPSLNAPLGVLGEAPPKLVLGGTPCWGKVLGSVEERSHFLSFAPTFN
uniref:Uncharacterized protein n=1 Tax=Oltmannsiellopsis viridis TaxID=51324 RepID=Q20F13_OLTVI|nr:hypothetical protein OlviCp011 [Oltmannsiellopsis viridis]ABB81993.1 hypothetical protein [Oltmannsiellopsis viridis]